MAGGASLGGGGGGGLSGGGFTSSMILVSSGSLTTCTILRARPLTKGITEQGVKSHDKDNAGNAAAGILWLNVTHYVLWSIWCLMGIKRETYSL